MINNNRESKFLIVVGGPTASGKTALAIDLAKHYNTEIISADSRQFYKELHIGVARPSESELTAIPHHFIASHSIHNPLSAGQYARACHAKLKQLHQNHSVVIMVGGSGLFVQAVVSGFHEDETESSTRKIVGEIYHTEGMDGLQKRLEELDPAYAKSMDVQNPQRLMRAIERVMAHGKSHTDLWSSERATVGFEVIEIAIDYNRESLYNRINKRVDEMIQNGLVEEVKSLLADAHLNALNTVGYKEIISHLRGNISLDEAVLLIKQNTRRYAKRQITWTKNKTKSIWVKPSQIESVIEVIEGKMRSKP